MRTLLPRERGLLIVTLAVLIGLALVFLVALPMRDARAELSRERRALTEKINEAALMYRQMTAVQEEIKRLREQQAGAFVNKGAAATPAMVRQVSQLSSDLGVRLSSIRPGEAEATDKGFRHPVSFRVEADFFQIVRMLYELEQGPGQLWVEGVEIAPGPKGSGQLSALVHVAAYSLGSN